MKKQLLASLLSLIFVAGLAPMAASATADNSTSCCSGSSDCPLDKGPCTYKVLTKEECQRFCKAKAAAIAKDPSLAKPENKCKLCCAIMKADPSMKPICAKLKKHCKKMKKHCMDNSCNKTSCNQSSSQDSSAQNSSSSSSQQSADASSSSMNSAVAAQGASASGAQQSSSSASSAN